MKNFLFKKSKNEKYENIEILGLNLKFKRKIFKKTENIHYFIKKTIFSSWKNTGCPKELMSLLKFLETTDLSLNPELLLVYSACLLESGNFDEAKRVLFKYLMLDNDIEKIANYLPVSKLAFDMGVHSALIDYAAGIFEKFENSRREKTFINFIKDKKIAIVGNGPQEIGKNKGAEIDAHDVVIRFNKFKLDGYESDYGIKTDVWCRNFQSVNENWICPASAKLVIYKGDYWHQPFITEKYFKKDIIKDDVLIDCIGYEENKTVKKYFPNQNDPTLGFSIALWILDYFKSFKNVDFYGFSFLEDTYKGCLHYFDNQENIQNQIQMLHHHKEESAILKQLTEKFK